MKARSARQIINKIGCPFLHLYQGEGYWYFEYDDGDKVFETKSVMVMYLNSMDIDQWVAEGRALLKTVRTSPTDDVGGRMMRVDAHICESGHCAGFTEVHDWQSVDGKTVCRYCAFDMKEATRTTLQKVSLKPK